jgi:hypothetical protein
MSHKPAGGPKSKNIVEPRVRTGTGPRSARPAGVAQIGTSWGNHATSLGGSSTNYRGERLHNDRTFQPVPFGNAVALNVKGGGPGTGRTIHEHGSQCQTGPVNPGSPRPAGRGILTNE